jgi:hypothetical protein
LDHLSFEFVSDYEFRASVLPSYPFPSLGQRLQFFGNLLFAFCFLLLFLALALGVAWLSQTPYLLGRPPPPKGGR